MMLSIYRTVKIGSEEAFNELSNKKRREDLEKKEIIITNQYIFVFCQNL